jgi:hypothetical protein
LVALQSRFLEALDPDLAPVTPAILSETFCGFSQSLQPVSVIAPRIRSLIFPPAFVAIGYSRSYHSTL